MMTNVMATASSRRILLLAVTGKSVTCNLGECPEFTRNVSFLLPYFAFYGTYIDERRR